MKMFLRAIAGMIVAASGTADAKSVALSFPACFSSDGGFVYSNNLGAGAPKFGLGANSLVPGTNKSVQLQIVFQAQPNATILAVNEDPNKWYIEIALPDKDRDTLLMVALKPKNMAANLVFDYRGVNSATLSGLTLLAQTAPC